MLIVSLGCLLVVLITAWSISTIYREGFATCNTQSTNAINDFNIFTLECKPNQYLSQLKRQQDGSTKKYSYKCCTDSSGNMQGPPGDIGEPGIQPKPAKDGAAGPQGLVGPQGPQGEKGARGPRGASGREEGDRGKPGEAGSVGPQGAQGLAGSPGKNAPGALEQSQKHGGKNKLEKVQLYLVDSLAKKRLPPPTSKLAIRQEDDYDDKDEDIMFNATTVIGKDGKDIYNDDELDIVEDFTTSCAQGKEYNTNTYKQSF